MGKCAVVLSLASWRWLFATGPPPSVAWAKRPSFGRCALCAMRMCGERTQGVALRDSCLLPLSSLTILLVGPFRLSAWFLLPWLLLAPPLLRPPALPYPGCCPSPCFPNRFPLAACLSSLPPVRVLLRFSEPPPSAPLPFWPFRVSPAPPPLFTPCFRLLRLSLPLSSRLSSPLLPLPVPPCSPLPSSPLPSFPFARPSPLSLSLFRFSLQACPFLPPLLPSLVSKCCLDAPGARSSGSPRGAHWPGGAMSGTNIAHQIGRRSGPPSGAHWAPPRWCTLALSL